jgi:hypothetical protein
LRKRIFRKGKKDGASTLFIGDYPNTAAVLLYYFFADGKANAGARVLAFAM